MDAKFEFCIKFYARIQIFRLLGPTKFFLWPFKILHLGISFDAESEFGIHFVSGSMVTTSLVLMSRTDFENKADRGFTDMNCISGVHPVNSRKSPHVDLIQT